MNDNLIRLWRFVSLSLCLSVSACVGLPLIFCSCAGEYPVVQRLIPVPLPLLRDSVNVVYKTDTLILGTHAHMNDTVVRIEYLPGKDKFFYQIKQDTLYIPVSDTIYLTKFLKPNNTPYYYIIASVLIFLLFLWILYPK